VKGEDASLPLANHDILTKRRKQELKHAQDVKELYQKKLERVNDLFMELNAWKLQLEETERSLTRKKRQLNQGSKVHYKKKMRPMVLSKAHERLQNRDGGRRTSYTIEAATSPESPFKLPQLLQPSSSSSRIGAAAVVTDVAHPVPQVRINPLYFHPQQDSDGQVCDSNRTQLCYASTTSMARNRVSLAEFPLHFLYPSSSLSTHSKNQSDSVFFLFLRIYNRIMISLSPQKMMMMKVLTKVITIMVIPLSRTIHSTIQLQRSSRSGKTGTEGQVVTGLAILATSLKVPRPRSVHIVREESPLIIHPDLQYQATIMILMMMMMMMMMMMDF
jgi:hypothetical protein